MKMKMNNKKNVTILTGALTMLLCGMSVNSYAATDTATITITGKVIASTCTIDSDSATQTITLSDIAVRDITGAGTIGGEKEVSIVLKDCGADTTGVTVTASGTEDSVNTSAFANSVTGDSGADGVALYFYNTDGTTIFKPDGSVQEESTLTPSVDNTLSYKAAYVGTKDAVTVGDFSTVVNMNFEYQ